MATLSLKSDTMRLPADEVVTLAASAQQSALAGRLDEARLLLEGLIVLEPQAAFLHTNLGCVLMRMGREDEALGFFDEALRLDASDVAAHTHAGELRLEREETDRAVTHFEAAIAQDPDGKNAFANRARTLRLRAGSRV
jgi:tetratricopeptide (TPR) repeat protein